MGRKLELAVLWCAVVAFLWGGYQLVTLPEPAFAANVIIDDALYFLVPAQHLIEGQGFSFDGHYLTNGVQTLWALITVGVAWLVPDTLTAMRAMSALSAAFWLAAGLLVWFGLRRVHRGVALFVACGWLMSAFTDRVAFQGMENGVHGMLFAAILVIACRARRSVPYVMLGVLCAFFGLARTESVLLAVLLCLAFFFGYAHPDGSGWRRGLHWRRAILFGVPVLVGVGGMMLLSLVEFGSLTPVSGRVKMFYEDSWGREGAHGPAFENLGWHFKTIVRRAIAPLTKTAVPAFGEIGIHVSASTLRVILLVVAVLGLDSVVIRAWYRRAEARPVRRHLLIVIGVFVLLHTVILALLLPHFTGYGTWYFAAETLGVWLILGWCVGGLLARLSCVLGGLRRTFLRAAHVVLPLSIVLLSLPRILQSPDTGLRSNRFLRAARWMDDKLPPGQRVSSLSAGLVGAYTRQHAVFNLDGLIASNEYFEAFLEPHRVPEFMERENIRWFADYRRIKEWAGGLSWCGVVPPDRLRYHNWWRLDDGMAYAVVEVLYGEERHRALAFGADTANALAEIRYAAEAMEDFVGEVVADDALAAHLDADRDAVVLASIPSTPSGRLTHVVVSPEVLDTMKIAPSMTLPEHEQVVPIGSSGLEVYGCDASAAATPGGVLVVTLYLRDADPAAPVVALPEMTMTIRPAAGTSAAVATSTFTILRGRTPTRWLDAGNAAFETVSLRLPPSTPFGDFVVQVDGATVSRPIQVH